jgi:hypothetical protein
MWDGRYRRQRDPSCILAGNPVSFGSVNAKPENRRQALSLLQTEPRLSDREVARRVGLGNKTVSRLRQQAGIERDVGPGALSAEQVAIAAGVSERQFRRWREHGLLPEPMRFYRPDSVEAVRAVKELMARYRNIDRVALGLLALGWPVSELRVRAACLRFLDRQERSFMSLYSIFEPTEDEATEDSAWADAAVPALTEHMSTSRSFQWARRAARGLQILSDRDAQLGKASDATWDYMENVTNIMVRGGLGSDQAVRELLTALPIQSSIPIGEQVRVTKAMHRASSLAARQWVAAEAPVEEIICTCDELVSIVVGYLVMMDAVPYLGGQMPDPTPPLLCTVLELDPSSLAYLSLHIVAIKHDPEIGEETTSWLEATYALIIDFVRIMLAQVGGRVPELEAVALRYLGNRAGRELLLTPPYEDEADSPN